jgi:hypothetical protein
MLTPKCEKDRGSVIRSGSWWIAGRATRSWWGRGRGSPSKHGPAVGRYTAELLPGRSVRPVPHFSLTSKAPRHSGEKSIDSLARHGRRRPAGRRKARAAAR